MDLAARFGDNLVRQRKLADVTQEELSIRASLHRTEVSQIERGLRVPKVDTLVKLAASLECGAEELLVGIHWDPGDVRPGNFKEPKEPERHEAKAANSQPERWTIPSLTETGLCGFGRLQVDATR